MQELNELPFELRNLKKIEKLYYCGNLKLLDSKKITIVGSRNPNPYAQNFTREIASKIAQNGGVVISGGALGVDIIAHRAALPNTIMISPSSLDIIYPKNNKSIIEQIYKEALILSQFAPSFMPKPYSFLERNKIVISLGECVIIPQADLESGSMQSANFALKLNKKVFVPPHRIGESKGTQKLIKEGKAKIIFDTDEFVEEYFKDSISIAKSAQKDELLEFCKSNPFFEEAYLRFGERVFEYELEGKIIRKNGRLEAL